MTPQDTMSCQRKLASGNNWLPAFAGMTMMFFSLAGYAATDDIKHWNLIDGKSNVKWTASYAGKPLEGSFSIIPTSVINFDSAHLDKSRVLVSVEIASLQTNDKDAKDNLPGKDWFDSTKFASATYASGHFKRIDAEHYVSDGVLKIRDKAVKTSVPFTLKFSGHNVAMDGETTIHRLDFKVGQGEFEKTDTVANEVKLSIHIEAKDN